MGLAIASDPEFGQMIIDSQLEHTDSWPAGPDITMDSQKQTNVVGGVCEKNTILKSYDSYLNHEAQDGFVTKQRKCA